MSLVNQALGASRGIQKEAEAPPLAQPVENKIGDAFDDYMKSSGLLVSFQDKVSDLEGDENKAEKGREVLKKVASMSEDALLSTVAANIYEDPLLARLVDSDQFAVVARMAAGRLADQGTLDKLASLGTDEIHRLASEGLKRKAVQKTAEVAAQPQVRQSFVPRLSLQRSKS